MLGELLQSHPGCWPWILTQGGDEFISHQPKCGVHQLHVRAWIVLETLERHRARDTELSKASIPAVPWEALQLSLSLLPAPAANGDGRG